LASDPTCPKGGWTLITLKEYFELRFQTIELLRAKEAEALIIQAKEYERRLEALNHEAKRINDAAAASVSREVWETYSRSDAAWKSQSERDRALHLPRAEFEAQHAALRDIIAANANRITVLEASDKGKQGGFSTIGSVVMGGFVAISALTSVIALLVSIFSHR
jgi:hypothetical protein